MMKHTLVYACNSNYFEMTLASCRSFMRHHNSKQWDVQFYDVGLRSEHRAVLNDIGSVIPYNACVQVQYKGKIYPSGPARLQMLIDSADKDVVLYLDSDTLVLGNVEELIHEFHQSSYMIGIRAESVDGFFQPIASRAWRGKRIPDEFTNRRSWGRAPMLNTGVVLLKGKQCADLGVLALDCYHRNKSQVLFAEQTILMSLIYDRGISYFELPIEYNCFVQEEYVRHTGKGTAYAECASFYNDKRIVIRHFCGDANKNLCKTLSQE